MTVPVLRTTRLTLRPFTADDLDRVTVLANNYAVSKMLVPVPYPYSREDAEDFLLMDQRGEMDNLWMIHDADVLCGAVSIGTKLGYWLGEPYWGRGYMTEAAGAAVAWYFTNRDATEIRSSHFVENHGSRRVLEKLNFVDTGPQLHFSAARQAKVPGRSMLLSRAAWQLTHG